MDNNKNIKEMIHTLYELKYFTNKEMLIDLYSHLLTNNNIYLFLFLIIII